MTEEIKNLIEEMSKDILAEVKKRLDDLCGCCQFELQTEVAKKEHAEALMKLLNG